ncbi:MAG: DNA polymerase I [Parachlamydiaceae bacterium]|nr:DNA polymerase I [Parachlamydiaceae bacterium]
MEKLYIIDASGYIYRSYFAIRQMTNSKGESTNALFGFVRSIIKLIKDFQPTHLVAVFDGPNNAKYRTSLYPEYKAHRQTMPPDLLHQILWAQEFCQLIGIPELMVPNVEADDTMGSVACWAANHGAISYLCTSDKDMCQLVNDHIFILNTFKENLIQGPKEIEAHYGVTPQQMIDYLAIMGDASDNIPGLSGFGPKTAASLLKQFGTLDYLLDHPKEVASGKKETTLIEEREKVLLSRRLVKIFTEVTFPQDPAFFKIQLPRISELKEFYQNANFSTLLRELETDFPFNYLSETLIEKKTQETADDLFKDVSYQLVNDKESLHQLVSHLSIQPEICIVTEADSIHPLQAKLVGIGLGYVPGKAWYIPLNGSLESEEVLQSLKPLLENPMIGFYGHHLKYDYHVMLNAGIQISHLNFDIMLASYLLNSHQRQHSLEHLCIEILGKVKPTIDELIGKGKQQIRMKDVPLEKVCHYCCQDVDYTIRIKQALTPQLESRQLNHLLYELELPLLPILAKMERHGIYIDKETLSHLSKELGQEIHKLAESIYEMAGEQFNLNSPKQLSEILFNKLGIHPPKKTATGSKSTNADVLEYLKKDYPIASKLLEYRTLEKLRSTYVDTLPQQAIAETNRIHCNFNQSVAATGRLSCQDPNLQNIPVRTEVGRKIREAFRPQNLDWSYLSADYSQIELRLLAHFSEDPSLVHAFIENEDIHTFTASQIFNIPLEEVTKEQRYQAKAVNFGIMYGQQAFGLSQELGIDNKTASQFIKRYFERYHKVKEFIDSCKILAKETGKAVTLFGRQRLIPEINSSNVMIRNMAERLAVNTPLQGTQADLIKLAMLEIDRKLSEHQLKAFMILQIHDELIFELPENEIPIVSQLVHDAMTKVIQLKVPIIVNINVGKNWKEC